MLHISLPLVHRYTNARHVAFHIIVIIVTWMLHTLLSHVHASLWHTFTTRVYMHVLFFTYYHMTHRAYYLDYCSMLLYSCYVIVSCYWYGYSGYWTCELLICDVWVPVTDMDIPDTGHDMDIPVTGHDCCWYAMCGTKCHVDPSHGGHL